MEGSEGQGSHISQAGVAIDGNLVAIGSIEYPVDDQGYFPAQDGETLRIRRLRGMRIVRCTSSREQSGFLTTTTYGAELHIPKPFEVIIERALSLGLKEPVVAHLGYKIGQLSDSTSGIKTRVQPLTDWSLRIDDQAGAINVAMSAALHATHLEAWNTSSSNYWSADPAGRIEVSFAVEPSTRIACYGSYIPGFDEGESVLAPIPRTSGSSDLDIRNAPVGTYAQFAISGGRWLHFYESAEAKTISITEHAPPKRTAAGFLVDCHQYRWPRVTIRGLDMSDIAAALAFSRSMRLSLRDGRFGQLSHDSRDESSAEIVGVDLMVELVEAGLKFTYAVETEKETKSAEFYLVWELLILRYPQFARYRRAA